ncbi:MAG: hypothetical protein CEO22_628 [Candidatus Berkelbacteria bacterium Gr01-1014_85]|uniref:Uncharacterized protein n=1 Tax=Candidatus Berkelbacteria bacterium Gr01-1014_85 TaxID=2017150 RepID=A0A554J9J3_9BACT|nr:MAG: hypothetical protein CEO22_628 [Candidatus Berkelbacteria bacterium Gr01-1014_85]
MERESVTVSDWALELARRFQEGFQAPQQTLKLDGPPPTDEELLAVSGEVFCDHFVARLVEAVTTLRTERYIARALWLLRMMLAHLFFRGIDFDDSLFWSTFKIYSWPTDALQVPPLELCGRLGIQIEEIPAGRSQEERPCLGQAITVVRCEVKSGEHRRLKWLDRDTPPEHLFKSAFEALCYASWYIGRCDMGPSRKVGFMFGYPGGWVVVSPDENRTAQSILWRTKEDWRDPVDFGTRTWYVFFPGLPEGDATSEA